MLAFVVKEIDIAKTVRAIEKIQNNNKNPYMHSLFYPVKSTDVAESYQTMHQIETGQLELRHIFADYSSIS